MHVLRLSPLGAALYAASAAAPLPAPSEDATAQAAEAATGTSRNAKLAAFQLCQAQDQAGADGLKKTGRTAAPVGATSGPCVDPGSPVVPISPATPAPSPGKSS